MFNSRKQLYRLTAGDRELFANVKEDPNAFLDWYFRGENTGTWLMPENTDSRLIALRARVKQEWMNQGRPENFFFHWEYGEHNVALLETLDDNDPGFHIQHGWMFQDWQLDIHNAKQKIIVLVGGFGCIAPETRIYDAQLNQHIPVEELYKQNRAPVVLAWTGVDFVEVQASIPWIKGEADLYRVRTGSGQSIVTTLDHQFLTEVGWKTLREICEVSPFLSLLISSQCLPVSTLDTYPSKSPLDDEHLSQTTLGFQGDCPTYSHLDDEQPHWAKGSDLVPAPSLNDAHVYIHENWHRGGWVHEPGDKFRSFRSLLNEYHLSTPDSIRLSERLEKLLEDYGCAKISVNVLSCASSPEIQVFPISEQNLTHSPTSPLSDRDTVETDCQNVSACFPPVAKPPITIIDPIESVEFVGTGKFYDLHVPVYENYLAEGFINHNSGKTITAMMSMLLWATVLPNFRGFALAPYSYQTSEMWKKLTDNIRGTRFAERFLIKSVAKDPKKIVIGNDLVGENVIDFIPILDSEEKTLNLEGDMAVIDQSEQFPSIPNVRRAVTSRLRGSYRGRERLGKTIWVANPYDNYELRNLFDEGEEHPDRVLSIRISSRQNTALSEEQVSDFIFNSGSTQQEIDSFVDGHWPVGEGKQFSGQSVLKCTSSALDELMAEMREKKAEGVRFEESPKIGITTWELPPEENGLYLVVADPGQDNPPRRNSAAIGVWDIAGFPEIPAKLRAFNWVFGKGSPEPWMHKFYEYVQTYKATGRCAYDSTGWQSGYQNWVEIFNKINSEGMSLVGGHKYSHINSTKIILSKGLLQYPTIPGITSQLTGYDLPDEGLMQDVAMMIILTCGWIERLFWHKIGSRDKMQNRFSNTVGRHPYQERAVAHRR